MRKIKKIFKNGFKKTARENLIHKLEKQGIAYTELHSSEFHELLKAERGILESDTKKVGAGIGIGLVLSMLLGFCMEKVL